MINIGIIGATAYTSLELIKILLRHPEVKITYLGVRRTDRPKISDIFPSLKSMLDLPCETVEQKEVPDTLDLAFITLPPTISMQYVPLFTKQGIKVIDLSADYRFRDKSLYEKWYKAQHTDDKGIETAVYGLPELFRNEIKKTNLVGNPGCYTTSTILALAPLLAKGLICSDDIIVDAKSGVSGRGREPREDTHYCECNENIEAYSIGGHRHSPEIEHILSLKTGQKISIQFVPHLIPMNRGILCTIYAKPKHKLRETTIILSDEEVRNLYKEFYSNEPFIRLKEGSEIPKTKDVIYTNFCDIATKVTDNRIIILSAIDNLIKGASGQAVQNMNIMCGFDEKTGLL
ncbi:MAG: N-acetyl-gamma-glutamyl-phosphate reductase [Candidatus Jettenia sp.]|uniref:N-acetyl-gamma-glutamyl-phosphate reductase n=1 Tax=Candidatus Jettenia caeni TaxID=247490 RepID=I3IJU2_9BACT|nr:N-acetyl-gamma-glutamyl-phosphate reductase [Candidatus Jettenia sp. AMX1]MBC6927780.1 N-acetyl-gamma-glutamyl-phosphate reductase [Candidatus Jettenia sp.]NUN24744.1 N-acetyl-gamma-glutamyl-phosphate reductase [Candidatus Jettenia caeni]KAA0250306.1 MAG: N-acetyl-gamma-glutamyl-phosphate reductase [Candidatus Jettenia sp. AMX1]MCE7879477.1 N-acetyl-gamma-glutamyl-phosphate reductase [Candidatus Jettenia sp. AMX1]MCQ3926101.1 N-acetyl-gamma-glutamyl-phosphate reductase [Candidatus Jettenia 